MIVGVFVACDGKQRRFAREGRQLAAHQYEGCKENHWHTNNVNRNVHLIVVIAAILSSRQHILRVLFSEPRHTKHNCFSKSRVDIVKRAQGFRAHEYVALLLACLGHRKIIQSDGSDKVY